MSESRYWITYQIIVFYCFLASARACMTFGDNPYIDLALSILALIIVPKHYFIHTTQRTYAAFFLAIAVMYTMIGATITAYVAQFSMIFIPLQLIFLKWEYQVELYRNLSKWFAILLICSIIYWALWLIGVPLPHTDEKLAWQYDDFGFIHQNYFLFRTIIAINPYWVTESLMRFNGFFLEPGHMGTITSLFLYINRFDFKKRINIVFLIVIVLSLSAAAYTVTLIGYCFYRYSRDKWKVVLPIAIVCLAIFIISQYNGGDNAINEIVLGKFTREQGAVEGRFSAQTQTLWNEILADGRIYFGAGAGVDTPQSAGYKVFLIMNGIFGALLVIIGYWLTQRINYSYLGHMLFWLMMISFLQRTYCFWDAFLDPFILGTAYLQIDTEEYDQKIKT